jgi:NAD(P)-dependent dehydrogenase (short-subunit alcohol dehydrogenase family)
MAFAQLDGKVAVVTGGAGLIGGAVVRTLAAHGAQVAIVDLAAERGGNLAKDVARGGGTAEMWTGNVSDESQVSEIFDSIAGRWGHIDALVTAAAPLALLSRDSALAELPADVWDDMMRGALRSTMLTCRTALSHLGAAGGGSIVTVSSIHANAADCGISAYSAAKAAIVALTRSIATQYGRAGIRCNAVLPGAIAPPGADSALVAGRVRHQVIGRPGRPEDVAHLVQFLCADESSFISGQAISVDGGTLIHMPSYADDGNFPRSS